MDIVGKLPVELAQNVFLYLPPEDLCNAIKCCDKWKAIAKGEFFWKKKLEIDFDVVGENNLNTPSYQIYVRKFANPWEGKYRYYCRLDKNWRRGSYKHQEFSLPWKINLLIYVDEEILMVAVNSSDIAIVNVFNGMVEHLFPADSLFFAEKCDNFLYALSKGGCYRKVLFKVWDLKTREQICEIQTALSPQCCSKSFYKHLIAYVPIDHKLHIYNINTGKLEYSKVNIYSVHCSKDLIAMGSQFGDIEILDVKYKPLIKLTCCIGSNISDIDIKDDYLAIICSPRIENGDLMARYVPKQKSVACVWNLTTQTKLENHAIFKLRLGMAFRRSVEVFDSIKPESFSVSNGSYVFMGHGAHSIAYMLCPKTYKSINKLDLDADFKYNDVIPRQCFFPIVSKTIFAYINEIETQSVVILDFGYIDHCRVSNNPT